MVFLSGCLVGVGDFRVLGLLAFCALDALGVDLHVAGCFTALWWFACAWFDLLAGFLIWCVGFFGFSGFLGTCLGFRWFHWFVSLLYFSILHVLPSSGLYSLVF